MKTMSEKSIMENLQDDCVEYFWQWKFISLVIILHAWFINLSS